MNATDTSERLRVFIVDDHPAFRRGVCDIIADEPDMTIVGEASNGEEAIARLRKLPPGEADLILMDIDLPGQSGIDVTRAILSEMPDVTVIMLTVSTKDEDLFDAIRAGAVGFLSKNLSAPALVRSIRDFHQGIALPIPAGAAAQLMSLLMGRSAGQRRSLVSPTPNPERSSDLTAREQEVLSFLALGKRDREIAEELFIEEGTVKKHVHNILRKLGVRNRTEAVLRVRQDNE
jgi:DNA-binding NarL/FixJ family response regulator